MLNCLLLPKVFEKLSGVAAACRVWVQQNSCLLADVDTNAHILYLSLHYTALVTWWCNMMIGASFGYKVHVL